MRNKKSQFSHQDGASFVLYEKIRIQPLRSSERMTLVDVDGNKAALAREYFQLGNEYFKKNQYKASISYFQSSLKYSYQSPQTHNNLGVLNALISQEQISLEYFKKSIQLRPKQIFAYINLANMQIKRGEYASGIQMYLDLLPQYKQKRILDNFNKIIRNYNNLYKYTKKYIRCAHRDIETSTVQDILKLALESVPKDAPISHQLVLSNDNIVQQADIERIKGTFEAIKDMYSKLHWNYIQSQFNKSIMYGQLLSQYLANLDCKLLKMVVCLLMSYFFIEKEDSSLSCYFNSLIDDGTPQVKHLKCYEQLYQNYMNLKKIKLLPYLVSSKVQTNDSDPEKQKRQVIITIQRLYFHKELYMYQLAELLQNESKIYNINEKQIQILANSLQKCKQLAASKYLFEKYRQNMQSYSFDYSYQNITLQLCQAFYMDDNGRKLDHQLFISQLDKELYSGECPISRQIGIFSFKLQYLMEKREYKTAEQFCIQALQLYPQKSDIFYQYLAVIYLFMYCNELEPSKELLTNANNMWEKSIIINPKNHQSHFQLFCVHYQGKREIAVRHLFRSLQICPERDKYFLWLAFVYQTSPSFQAQIDDFLLKLQKQYTKATDFKVKANIAIFQLYTEKYDLSYTFFKNSMKDAYKEDDTNCEDLLFMYFVNKLFWIYYHIAVMQHNFRFQLLFYLIIFIKSPQLFEKYEYKTHLCDKDIYKQIERDLAVHIQLGSIWLIQKIQHLDLEHKSLIYQYIFKQVFKKVVDFDPVVFYAELKQLQPSLMKNVQTYEVVADLKQQKILKIKQFITYISKRYQRDVVKHSKLSDKISLHIIRSTFYNISHVISTKQGISNQIIRFKQRIKKIFRYADTQIQQECILSYQDGISLLKTSDDIVSLKQSILEKLKYLEVICLIFQYFYCFIEENSTLKSFINKLCKKLLLNKNLDDMFFKLRNYIVEDYISSNSNISLFSSSNYDQQSQMKFFDNTRIDFSQNPVLQSQKIEFIEENNVLRDCLPFYKLSIPQWKEIEIFLFAVKLIVQFERQGFILQELSIEDFKIQNSQILFYGIKKTVKGQSEGQHLTSLQQFFKKVQQKCQNQAVKKCRFYITLLFNKKIKYNAFITKVTSICRQIKIRQPQSRYQ